MITTSFSLNTLEYFLLILVRMSTFVFVAPFFGMRNVPRQVKVGFSIVASLLVFYTLEPTMETYSTTTGYAVLVLIEGITGLLIGFMANICNSIILYAGNLIDTNIGLSMASEYNPAMAMQTTVSGDLYYYLVMILLVVTNMHHYIIRALVDSFQLIPLGGAVFDLQALMQSIVRFCTDMIVISFRIELPVFGCIMILNCVLGIMAKVAPQMNMFAVGMQLKVLVGLVVMLLTVFLLPQIADFIFREMKTMVNLMIKGMI